MSEWELSFAELQVARNTVYQYYLSIGKEFGMAYETDCERAIATAAQRKLVEWWLENFDVPMLTPELIEKWKAFKAALGVKDED